MPADEGVQAEGLVKWFNSVKGFGFVAVNNQPSDAFLHISVVNRAGLQSLAENTRILCMVAPSARGAQITRIIQVLGVDPNAPPPPPPPRHHGGNNDFNSRSRDDYHGGRSDFGGNHGGSGYGSSERTPPTGPGVEVTATIKWYKPEKGFGFAVPDDGGKDIFVHRSILAAIGFDSIEPGRKVRLTTHQSHKGREASALEVMD